MLWELHNLLCVPISSCLLWTKARAAATFLTATGSTKVIYLLSSVCWSKLFPGPNELNVLGLKAFCGSELHLGAICWITLKKSDNIFFEDIVVILSIKKEVGKLAQDDPSNSKPFYNSGISNHGSSVRGGWVLEKSSSPVDGWALEHWNRLRRAAGTIACLLEFRNIRTALSNTGFEIWVVLSLTWTWWFL